MNTKNNGASDSGPMRKVNVQKRHKISLKKATELKLLLAPGQEIMAIGGMLIPYHDKAALQMQLQCAKDRGITALLVLGGAFHDGAFHLIRQKDPDAFKGAPKEMLDALEIARSGSDSAEDRILALASTVGDTFKTMSEFLGPSVKIIYIPAYATYAANEMNIIEMWNNWNNKLVDNYSKEKKRPGAGEYCRTWLPKTFEQLFGLENHPNIKVLGFGSAVIINGQVRAQVSYINRKNPGDASDEYCKRHGMSMIVATNGKNFFSYETKPSGDKLRCEIGHLADEVTAPGLGEDERRCLGFGGGIVRPDGFLSFKAVPILRGLKSKCRGFIYYGRVYREETPGGYGEKIELDLRPKRKGSTKKKGSR